MMVNLPDWSMKSLQTPPSILLQGLTTSFLDENHPSEEIVRASLLANKPGEHKILDDIEHELLTCDSFCFSVAFITLGGLVPLLQTLKELEEKGIPGRILTTDYQHFTEPAALEKLLSLKNIALRLYRTRADRNDGFHTKGYLFTRGDFVRLVVGSSNLTDKALSVSHEWNTRLVTLKEGALAKQTLAAFEQLWSCEQSWKAQHILDEYKEEFRIMHQARAGANERFLPASPKPNAMQEAFLDNLEQSLKQGRPRALLISATGTGKTYAAAFAVRRIKPKSLLFLVHREQIANQAQISFKRVLGGKPSDFGLISGSSWDYPEAKYLFATMQTMVRHLKDFKPKNFDCILIDEVHRAGAPSYQRIMQHFQPKFWLGMTGSPDRPDGFDIYGLFDHNIVYEIRLQQALEYNLLCPFHYFGIGGLAITDANGQTRQLETHRFVQLENTEIIRHILDKAEYYGFSGERVKGLVFAADIESAQFIAQGFCAHGYKALALSGRDSQDDREKAVRLLTKGEGEDRYDYLVTVDIFNEGVDLPEVNQVILLRPTESPIIFVQQLGRGLRKFPGKEFVVVLDFIGSYDTNFLIPVALSGDRSYTKENMRRLITDRRLPGVSSIHFDAVARERIFRAIEQAKTDTLGFLKPAYFNLKNKLGRIPSLLDYKEHGEVDAILFLQPCTRYSYYNFLKGVDKEYTITLTNEGARRIAWISRKLGSAIRPSEALVLRAILNGKTALKADLQETLRTDYGFHATDQHLNSVFSVLTNNFERTEDDKRRSHNVGMLFIQACADGEWAPHPGFLACLANDTPLRPLMDELLTFILDRWQTLYSTRYKDTMFCLGARYTFDDVLRMLDWSRSYPLLNVGGYRYDEETKTLPLLVTFLKTDKDIPYQNRLLSPLYLTSQSKTGRRTDSEDAQQMTKQPPFEETAIHLFVRKRKRESFYYLGEVDACSQPSAVEMNGRMSFVIHWKLRHPIESGLYQYLTGEVS